MMFLTNKYYIILYISAGKVSGITIKKDHLQTDLYSLRKIIIF